MKITPVGPVRTTKVARVRRASEAGAPKVTETHSPNSKASVGDDVSIMGIPEAEFTPKVRDAIMKLIADVGNLREELKAAREDLSAARQEIAAKEKLANEDPLLPLPNRRAFVEELSRTMAHVERYGNASSVVYIDVNDLKEINDTFGHGAGDKALKHVADILLANIRESDRVGRLGGDEFCLILDEADTDSAREKAYDLAKAITDKPFEYDKKMVTVQVAVGVYTFNGVEDVNYALSAADKDMYIHKKQLKDENNK